MKLAINKKKTIDTVARYLLCFLIPFVIVLILYHALEILPYGDNSILCMDLWGQYFPMYKQIGDYDSFSDFFYSWKGALGFNNYAQSAYYCNSIFNLLFLFCDTDNMIKLLDIIAALKVGFSAAACMCFFEVKFKRKTPFYIALSASYALCAYALAYLSQCMWTDCLIYMPLIMAALVRLIEKRRTMLYTILLAICMISSFYISFSMCLFLVLFFIMEFVSKVVQDARGGTFRWKSMWATIGRFALGSILAAGIACIVLLPVWKAINNTIASESEFPSVIEWYGNVGEYLNALLPETSLSLEYGIPNIATGIMVFLFVPLFFSNTRVPLNRKIVAAVLLVVLFLSMNMNVLNYIWHGFHFPNQLPGRWSFLISLVLVMLCAEALEKLEGLHPISIGIGWVASIVLLVISRNSGEGEFKFPMAYVLMITVMAAGLMFISLVVRSHMRVEQAKKATAPAPAEKTVEQVTEEIATEQPEIMEAEEIVPAPKKAKKVKKLKKEKPTYTLVMKSTAFAVASALTVYSVVITGIQFRKNGKDNLPKSPLAGGYTDVINTLSDASEEISSLDDGLYRVEANTGFTFDSGMLGNYNGIGYYSSTMDGRVYELLRYLGNRVYAENVSTVYNYQSPVQNSLFGIKYIIDRDKTISSFVYGVEQVEENSDGVANIYQNPTALPIAYAVSDSIQDFETNDEIRAVSNQNALLNAMTGEESNVFEVQYCGAFGMDNCTIQENQNWNSNYFSITDSSKPVIFQYTYTIEEDGAYYCEHNFRAGTIHVTSSVGHDFTIDPCSEKLKYVSEFHKGDVVTFEVDIEGVGFGCCGFNFYRLNDEKWNQVYETLSTNTLEVTDYTNTKIEGTITVTDDQTVFTSIPQDGGWSVYSDGEKVEPVLLCNDVLIGVKLPAGTHTLKFVYHVPGLRGGVAISLCSLAVVILLFAPFLSKPREQLLAKLPKRKKKAKKGKTDEEKTEEVIYYSETEETTPESLEEAVSEEVQEEAEEVLEETIVEQESSEQEEVPTETAEEEAPNSETSEEE